MHTDLRLARRHSLSPRRAVCCLRQCLHARPLRAQPRRPAPRPRLFHLAAACFGVHLRPRPLPCKEPSCMPQSAARLVLARSGYCQAPNFGCAQYLAERAVEQLAWTFLAYASPYALSHHGALPSARCGSLEYLCCSLPFDWRCNPAAFCVRGAADLVFFVEATQRATCSPRRVARLSARCQSRAPACQKGTWPLHS